MSERNPFDQERQRRRQQQQEEGDSSSARDQDNPYDHAKTDSQFSSGDPYRKFNFTVSIDDEEYPVAGFQEVSGLEMEVEPETYEEGGRHGQPHYLPGTVTFPDLTLKRGLTNSTSLYNWMTDVRLVMQRSTGRLNEMKRTVRVELRSGLFYSGGDETNGRGSYEVRQQNAKSKGSWVWNFYNAYPVGWSGPDLDATSGDGMAIQELTIKHEGFSKGSSGE